MIPHTPADIRRSDSVWSLSAICVLLILSISVMISPISLAVEPFITIGKRLEPCLSSSIFFAVSLPQPERIESSNKRQQYSSVRVLSMKSAL